MSSIFTKIINREIPAEIVHEDDQAIAFLDIRPVHPGHLLVVPKQEVDEFQDLDTATYQAVMTVVYELAQRLKERLQPDRVGVVIYGFDVPHAHIHVIPLYAPGDISMNHSPEATSEDLQAMREKLTEDQ